PEFAGTKQFASLRCDTDAATIRQRVDGLLMEVPGERDVARTHGFTTSIAPFMRGDTSYLASRSGTEDSVAQGYLAATKKYDLLYNRIKSDLQRLAAAQHQV